MPAIRGSKSKKKTRRNRRGLDQIHADLNVAGHLQQYQKDKTEEDLPGLGQYYCTECAKWFDQEGNLAKHARSKAHKKRVKALQEQPYTQKEAEAAVGLWTDNGKSQRDAMDIDEEEAEQDPAAAIVS
ncbi:MAG: hypothetical protein Q9162_003575 [Coniocarpon cinnabarinum]